MNGLPEKKVDELMKLSRVEFLKKFEDKISQEFNEYQSLVDDHAFSCLTEEDDSMLYAYNEELPKIF